MTPAICKAFSYANTNQDSAYAKQEGGGFVLVFKIKADDLLVDECRPLQAPCADATRDLHSDAPLNQAAVSQLHSISL